MLKVPAKRYPWEAQDDQHEYLHNRPHQVNRKRGKKNPKSHLMFIQKTLGFKLEVTELLFTRNIQCSLLSAEIGAHEKFEFSLGK